MRALVAIALVVALATPVAATAAILDDEPAWATAVDESAPEGRIVAVHANPAAPGDRGEYVVVEHSPGAGWVLGDGETTVRLPGAEERVVVTATPAAVNATLGQVRATGHVVAADDLRLSNAGERLRLRHGSTVVDEVIYQDAPESEVLRPDDGGWTPLGATDFGVAGTGPSKVEAFVLPDAPAVPVRTIREADRRVLLAGYTLTSWQVARALAAASDRGATVRVLVDGGPVGGISRREARILDWLVGRGIPVEVLDGPRARYEFHHAKYAVVDDRALVLTENFKPSGTGGHASRGWGAVVHDADAAAHLARVFEADAGWRDTVAWRAFRENRSFESGGAANGSYPTRFRPREVRAEEVRVLLAPDNAERVIVETVESAEESALVQQVSISGRRQPFLRATVDAARRGVTVRVLLSSAWYVRDDNRRLVEWLNGLADREGVPMRARLAEPRSRYGKIHAKGLVVDGDTVVLGSINWNNHSARENREVDVVLEGEAVGGYYERAFWADWRGGTRRLPAGVALVVVLATAGGVVTAREVNFQPES